MTLNPITLFCLSSLDEFFFVLLNNHFIFVYNHLYTDTVICIVEKSFHFCFMNTVFYSYKDISIFISFYLYMWSLFPSIVSVDVIGCLLFLFSCETLKHAQKKEEQYNESLGNHFSTSRAVSIFCLYKFYTLAWALKS